MAWSMYIGRIVWLVLYVNKLLDHCEEHHIGLRQKTTCKIDTGSWGFNVQGYSAAIH